MEQGGRWERDLNVNQDKKKIVMYQAKGGGEWKRAGRRITGEGTPKGEVWASGARLTPSKNIFSLMVYQLGEENCILCVSNYHH